MTRQGPTRYIKRDDARDAQETGMEVDPSSPRHGMGTGVAFLAAIALTCGLVIAASIFL